MLSECVLCVQCTGLSMEWAKKHPANANIKQTKCCLKFLMVYESWKRSKKLTRKVNIRSVDSRRNQKKTHWLLKGFKMGFDSIPLYNFPAWILHELQLQSAKLSLVMASSFRVFLSLSLDKYLLHLLKKTQKMKSPPSEELDCWEH